MSVKILVGDCLPLMKKMPPQSFQMCVTSPPYFGLRNYGEENQIGQEETTEIYIGRLVEIFREVKRVLRDDGTLWLNLGDCYLKKQRQMIPARMAIELKKDGWWLRDEIIWHKPRTTPFPAKDRTVPAHEMIYLLSKKERYFFDWEAIEEPAKYAGAVRQAGKAFRDLEKMDPLASKKRPSADRVITVRETRRSRSVWSISPSPYKDGHFATMPPSIAERCIKAGSRIGDVVLDPFGGAGTTAMMAEELKRKSVLCELNREYADLAKERINKKTSCNIEVIYE